MLGTELFVEMFFVLSAFVLWLPIARTAIEGRSARPGRVLLFRRMSRLAPLYVTVVLMVWALTNPTLPGHWQDLVLHLTFTQVYSDQFIFWANGPAWSLAVEFHFYVLMALCVPLVNAGVRRVRSRAARLAVVSGLPVLLVAGGLLYLAWATVWSPVEPDNWSVLFSPLSRAADFGVGTALAVITAAGVRLPGWARGSTAVLGLAALGGLVATRPIALIGEWWHPAYSVAIALALTAIVLHDGPWPAVLGWRPLAWVGGLGYGIYLIHEPVMRVLGDQGLLPAARPGAWFLLTALLVAVPTAALAWLSSHTVERAGARLATTIDRRGRPRDYYAHLRPAEPVHQA
jgi:peptidoglycan/LPS O-acetylase OafA/YrhL